jgi:hypothetical protein
VFSENYFSTDLFSDNEKNSKKWTLPTGEGGGDGEHYQICSEK